jgi:AraC-like DNA-binding protein
LWRIRRNKNNCVKKSREYNNSYNIAAESMLVNSRHLIATALAVIATETVHISNRQTKMKLTEYIPTEQLRPYIKTYKIIESRWGTTNRVLPNTSFAMSFCFKGQISYLNNNYKTPLDLGTFSGLQQSTRLINYDADTSAIIIIFKETGLPAFFKQPFHELYGRSISLDNFFSGSEILIIQEQLFKSNNDLERIANLEEFLLSKLTHFNSDKLISEAVRMINTKNGNLRIKDLAKDLFISQDAFEKRFRKIIGATPKQFSHIVKMNSAISKNKSVPFFLDLAFENGYYDQPHFNNDFKKFTGQTPTDFFRSASFW